MEEITTRNVWTAAGRDFDSEEEAAKYSAAQAAMERAQRYLQFCGRTASELRAPIAQNTQAAAE